jgi:hypothetical protein
MRDDEPRPVLTNLQKIRIFQKIRSHAACIYYCSTYYKAVHVEGWG